MTTNNDDLSNKEDVVVKEQQPTTTYAELYEKLYPKPDPEQLKKNAKRARTRNIIAALGDGISAIANLHYTTKGAPNMYDGKSTLSAKSQARYDKLMQDYKDNLDKYKQGQLKAEQLDKEWNHRAEREKVADEHNDRMYQLGVDKFEHEKSQAKQTQNNWQNQFDYTKGRDGVLDERYKTEQEAKAAAVAQAQSNADRDYRLKEKELDAKMQGDYYSFIGDNNSPAYVHKDRLLTDDVFDQLVSEGIGKNNNEHDMTYKNRMKEMSKLDRKTFIANNWSKSDAVRRYAMANAYSGDNKKSDEDFSQYEVTSDDDFSQYEVK